MELPAPKPAGLPAQPLAPLKNRRGWLIAFGVIHILIAGVCLFVVAFAAKELLTGAAEIGPADLLGFPVCGSLTAVFITLGVGSIKCKNWARIASQVVSGLWLFVGVALSLTLVFVIPKLIEPRDHIQPAHFRLAIVGSVLFMVVLPASLLVFYSLKSVRATCQASRMSRTS